MIKSLERKQLLGAVLSFFMGVPALTLAAYPETPVRMLVGVAPGGATDIVARIFAQHMGHALDASFVVENRPGAAGILAATAAAKADADGYTLVVAPPTVMVVAPYLYKTLPFSPAKD